MCFTAPLIALTLSLFAAHGALAQGTVISGRVTNQQGAPVAGANVAIPTLGVRAEADSSGNYRLGVPARAAAGQAVTVVTRFIGFAQAQRSVTLAPGEQTVNFSLVADPFNLSAVVVTGVATGTEQRKLPFTVAHVSEEQVTKVPASSPVAALEGKVAGARISLGNGAPGTVAVATMVGIRSVDSRLIELGRSLRATRWQVFEHLERPAAALSEMARVARRYVLVSVPREPLWRAANVAAGRYLRELGNTPGHIQHFSRRGIATLVGTTADVAQVSPGEAELAVARFVSKAFASQSSTPPVDRVPSSSPSLTSSSRAVWTACRHSSTKLTA